MNKGSEVQRAAAFIHDCYGMYRHKECKSGMYKLNRYTKGDFLKERGRVLPEISRNEALAGHVGAKKNSVFILWLKRGVAKGRGFKPSFAKLFIYAKKSGKTNCKFQSGSRTAR